MKKTFTLLALAIFFIATAQEQVKLISSTPNETVIEVNASNFTLQNVNTPNGTEAVLKSEGGTVIHKKGAPNLVKFSEAIIIPNDQKMSVEVIDAVYEDIPNIHIAPSKGIIYRDVNPETVAYEYGEEYNQNKFYPENLASLSEPFIMRDVRGISVKMNPYQYNPVTKTLRVYSKLKVKVYTTGQTDNVNVLVAKKGKVKVQEDFAGVYSNFFFNYSENTEKYTPVEEGAPGRMLVICYASFMDEMQDFVDWKNQKGIFTEMVDVATIGNASAIKTYVQTYYDTHSDFSYLLLVGDAGQVPSSYNSGDSDNDYGYVVGTDSYIDIFVGRFSAETGAQVTTQVDRTIHYEKDVTASETWMARALGSGSSEGSPDDATHINAINDGLGAYGYTTEVQHQAGGSNAGISNWINGGCGVINYCGHGADTYWVNTSYAISNVNGLTNSNQLPFIFDVACVNGNFVGQTCFAEAWLRATNGSNPTGAIAICASTINQSWTPPMYAQTEMNDLVTQSISGNVKRTFGGVSACGWAEMNDVSGDYAMSDTWTIFGDASVMLRTKQASAMTVSHGLGINLGATSFTVTCNEANALISITKDNVILGTAYANGATTVSLSPAISGTGTILVTVTAFNKVTYQSEVNIILSADPPVCDFSGTPLTILEGESVTFTDLSTNYPDTWNWNFGDLSTNSTIQNPSHTYTAAGTYTVMLAVSNGNGNDSESKTAYITVNANTSEPTADFVASATSLNVGDAINFTDLSTDNPSNWYWEFEGGTPGTSTLQNPVGIVYNGSGTFQAKLTASNAYGSDIETKYSYITVSNANFSLDFEACIDYSSDFTPWQSVNTDGKATYGSSDCDFPGEETAFGFMAFNPNTAGFTLASTHGGDRCGMAICPSDASASDNWIISAQLNLGVNTSLSFWVLSPKTGSWGTESFNVLVSTTGNATSDFTAIESDITAPDSWAQVIYDLSAYDNQQIYVAIQHVSADKFMFWVDDIEITSEVFTGVNNIITDNLFSVYPNPNNGSFIIKTNVNDENTVIISDITGKVVWETKTSMNIIDVNLVGLNKGIYFVNVSNENNIQVEKIIIR